MTRGGRTTFLLALSMSGFVCAQAPDSGTIRVWGSAQMAGLMTGWQKSFSRSHPRIQFDNHFYGAVSAIAGVYTGVADMAVSREIWPAEATAFEQVTGHQPVAIPVATGSFDVPTKSDSLEIFVHRENPIAKLTLDQLAAVFGAGHPRKWGELGLKDEWAGKPIHAYGFQPDNAGALFFSDVVLRGSRQWTCQFQGFANRNGTDGARTDAGQLILEALAKDRYGIAISNLHYSRPEVKALALAVRSDGPYVTPVKENVLNRTYPLTRAVYIFLNRAGDRPLDRNLAEFLRYVLSREGQQDVTAEGAYLPLPLEMARQQLERVR